MKDGIKSGKEGPYKEGWEGPIDPKLRTTLEELEKYLALTEEPSRHESTSAAILQTHPVHEISPEERRDSLASALIKCDRVFQNFTHHNFRSGKEEKFEPALQTFEQLLLQVFNPSAVDVQKAVRIWVTLDAEKEDEAKLRRILGAIKKRPSDFEFFFKNLRSPTWLKTLDKNGIFKTPTPVKKLENNYIQYPLWVPMFYLVAVAPQSPEEVIAICRRIPRSDNPRIYRDILNVALAVADRDLSIKLLSKIKEGIKVRSRPFNDHYGSVLAHWSASEKGVEAALGLAAELLAFDPDPRKKRKVAQSKREKGALYTLLNPPAKFESWSFQQIVNEGLVPLSAKEPCRVALLLIKTLNNYIDLTFSSPDEVFERIKGDDLSSGWCPRVHGHQDMHLEPNRALVHAITAACKLTITRRNESEIVQLDSSLRDARWKIFTRIQHHLYAKFPDLFREQIQESILGYAGYGEDDYGRERAEMVQAATKHYGPDLLSPEEYNRIISAILEGPDHELYKQQAAERYDEAHFQSWRNYLCRQQLWPFAGILSGEAQQRLNEVNAILRSQPPTLDDYSPVISPVWNLTSESPVTEDELVAMSDEQMIEYLNTWDQRRLDPNRNWVTIDVDGLQGGFGRALAKHRARFAAWNDQWDRLNRPIFLRGAFELATREVEQKNFSSLEIWFRLCRIGLAKPVPVDINPRELAEESAEKPRWERVRSSVLRFLEVSLKPQIEFPLEHAPILIELLENLCAGPDTSLDQPDSHYRSNSDPISTAINTNRGRAIELVLTLVLRLKNGQSAFADVAATRFKAMVDRRFSGQPPLTDPEQALLGSHIAHLIQVDPVWTADRRNQIFGRVPISHWLLTFGSFLRFNHAPYPQGHFEALKSDYEFALGHLKALRNQSRGQDSIRESMLDSLGMHLFSHYLWERYPLTGQDSLLDAFITQATMPEIEALIRNIGELVGQVNLQEKFAVRAQAFLDARISAAEAAATVPSEFQSLYGWLKNDRFPAEWRLGSLLRLLNLDMPVNAASLFVECLLTMLPDHLELVVRCFAKISDYAKDPTFYVDPKDGRVILEAAANSNDDTLKELAKQAQENLVAAGYSEFLD